MKIGLVAALMLASTLAAAPASAQTMPFIDAGVTNGHCISIRRTSRQRRSLSDGRKAFQAGRHRVMFPAHDHLDAHRAHRRRLVRSRFVSQPRRFIARRAGACRQVEGRRVPYYPETRGGSIRLRQHARCCASKFWKTDSRCRSKLARPFFLPEAAVAQARHGTAKSSAPAACVTSSDRRPPACNFVQQGRQPASPHEIRVLDHSAST